MPHTPQTPQTPKILITETLDETCAAWLSERFEVVHCPHDQAAELAKHLPGAEGLVVRTYTQVNDAFLARAPMLKVVGRAGVGLDNIDVDACRRRGVEVVYTPDANTQAVVEYVTALMLDALRPRPTLAAPVSAETYHQLRKEEVGRQLDELTLGIIGFGRIGKRLGKVAHAIGMKVMVNDLIAESQLRAQVDFPVEFATLSEVCAEADVLTIHVDGRAGNRHLINEPLLKLLKPNSLFINASRGFVVDETALADWARRVSSQGGQAVLDVQDPEPPTAASPLFGLANVRLLPHIASRTRTAMSNMSWVVRDVATVLRGEQPRYRAQGVEGGV